MRREKGRKCGWRGCWLLNPVKETWQDKRLLAWIVPMMDPIIVHCSTIKSFFKSKELIIGYQNMAKARKTRQVKATTTQKATQAKRKPLKNLDKNLANGKSKSQKPKVSRIELHRSWKFLAVPTEHLSF